MTGYKANLLAALEFKRSSTTNCIDIYPALGGEGPVLPGGLINSRGNRGSGGTLAFDDLDFSGGSKSNNNNSFLDIKMHRQGVSVGSDADGVMHRV
jgi:hypothetical protein